MSKQSWSPARGVATPPRLPHPRPKRQCGTIKPAPCGCASAIRDVISAIWNSRLQCVDLKGDRGRGACLIERGGRSWNERSPAFSPSSSSVSQMGYRVLLPHGDAEGEKAPFTSSQSASCTDAIARREECQWRTRIVLWIAGMLLVAAVAFVVVSPESLESFPARLRSQGAVPEGGQTGKVIGVVKRTTSGKSRSPGASPLGNTSLPILNSPCQSPPIKQLPARCRFLPSCSTPSFTQRSRPRLLLPSE